MQKTFMLHLVAGFQETRPQELLVFVREDRWMEYWKTPHNSFYIVAEIYSFQSPLCSLPMEKEITLVE